MSWIRGHWIMVAVAGGLAVVYLLAKARSGGAAATIPGSVSPASQASGDGGSGSVSSSGGEQPIALPTPYVAGASGGVQQPTPAGAVSDAGATQVLGVQQATAPTSFSTLPVTGLGVNAPIYNVPTAPGSDYLQTVYSHPGSGYQTPTNNFYAPAPALNTPQGQTNAIRPGFQVT